MNNEPLSIRIQIWISYLIRLLFIFAGVYAAYHLQWTIVLVCVLALLCFTLPALLERSYKIVLPTEFELILSLFIYGTLYLGEIQQFYEVLWWWDAFLHAISGLTFGFIGFLLLYILYERDRLQASAFMVAMFSLMFAMGIGGVWEIFEYCMDQIFNLNMQKSGLQDTMWDLIVDFIGGLLAAIFAYSYIKYRRSSFGIFHHLLLKFLQKNRRILHSLHHKDV